MKNIKILEEILLELFFPSKCVICGTYLDGYICSKCLDSLPIPTNYCKICGTPLTYPETICYNCKKGEKYIDELEFLGYYQGIWEKLITKFKFENKPFLAKTFAQLGKTKINKRNWDINYITFVPMWRDKEIKRGFNQSKVLSIFLSKELNIKSVSLLHQKRPTLEQKSLNYKDRISNVKDAYKILNNEDINGKNILLVDDVYTTGATLNECAKELKQGGAKVIFSFVICRTILG